MTTQYKRTCDNVGRMVMPNATQMSRYSDPHYKLQWLSCSAHFTLHTLLERQGGQGKALSGGPDILATGRKKRLEIPNL